MPVAKTVPMFHRQLFSLPLKAQDGTPIVAGMDGLISEATVLAAPDGDIAACSIEQNFVQGQPFGVFCNFFAPAPTGKSFVIQLRVYRQTSFGGITELGKDTFTATVTNNGVVVTNGVVTDAPITPA